MYWNFVTAGKQNKTNRMKMHLNLMIKTNIQSLNVN